MEIFIFKSLNKNKKSYIQETCLKYLNIKAFRQPKKNSKNNLHCKRVQDLNSI